MSSEQGVVVREQEAEEIGLTELRQRLPQLKAMAELVREFQREVLREGIDYGPIPGTGDRSVLKKPGAESLIEWHKFGVPVDDIEREEHDWQTGFHYYLVRISLRSKTGRTFTSVRTCSTFEKKFRYHKDGTERSVADLNSQCDNVLAMANKRALVAVTRLATATSGLFDEEYDSDESDEDIRVPFGRDKGKLVSELTVAKDVSWLADAIHKSINDPEKKRFKVQNEKLHAALTTRLAELSAPPPAKENAPAPSSPQPPDPGGAPSWQEKLYVEVEAVRGERDPQSKGLRETFAEFQVKGLAELKTQADGVRFFAAYLKRTGKQPKQEGLPV